MIGLICLIIAPLATLANYQLLYFSMESLIPPSSDALWLVAGTLTALHAVAGLLFHMAPRFSVRLLLCGVLIVSLSCEAWFSFQRTMELENAASAPAVHASRFQGRAHAVAVGHLRQKTVEQNGESLAAIFPTMRRGRVQDA